MRQLLLSISATVAAVVPPPQPPITATVGELDRRSASYLEDHLPSDTSGPRAVADMLATLLGDADGVWLRLAISAQGPRVEPIPGIEGVPGVNLRTAEELHLLLREDRLQLVTRDGRASLTGELMAVERQQLPMRRLRPDGSIDVSAVSAAELPVRVSFASHRLPPGRSRTYLLANGLPRLLIEVERDDGGDRITAVESLGELLAPTTR